MRSMFHAPHEYGHIWQSILALPILAKPILELVMEELWKDWSFHNNKSIFAASTNHVCHNLVEDRV